jgi:predicted CXXCH cytochrome family protein
MAVCLLVLAQGCSKSSSSSADRAATQPEGASIGHYLAPGAVRPVAAMSVLPPAPKPKEPLPPDTSCVSPTCHAAFATAPHVHSPVAAKACDTCHQPDAGGHHYPLKRAGTQTCTFCHAVSGTAAYQHTAQQQGCLACHSPHISNAKYLLKVESVGKLCSSCHQVPLRKHAHAFIVQGECTLCHLPHQSDNRFLLRGGEGPKHCFMCHADVQAALAAAPHRHEPVTKQCTSCHSPHSTDFPHQLKAPLDQACLACHDATRKHIEEAKFMHGAVTSGRRCGNCHDAHASSQPKLLHARADKLCLECHDQPVKAADGHMIANMTSALRESKYLHGPVKDGECSACHDPHASNLPQLFTKTFPKSFYIRFDVKQYDLCFQCHTQQLVLVEKTANLTGFRNGQTNLHYLHVNRDDKGRTCKTCHAVHGSNEPKHMASEVPFEGSDWAMPIRYEKSPQGGQCTPGCHGQAKYDREHPAPRPVPASGPTTIPTTKGAP